MNVYQINYGCGYSKVYVVAKTFAKAEEIIKKVECYRYSRIEQIILIGVVEAIEPTENESMGDKVERYLEEHNLSIISNELKSRLFG